MIYQNQQKAYIKKKKEKKRFSQKVIGTRGLILCANPPCNYDSHESLPTICDKVKEHIWGDF